MSCLQIDRRIVHSFFRALSLALSTFILVCGLSRVARADCVPARKAPSPKNVTSQNKTRARGQYKLGNEFLRGKDYEGALALFLQSRNSWQNRSNTKNAAICLFELGRYPEALAMYEELLDRFTADLDDQERALIANTISELKKKVFIADIVESNGTFSIDDEACGPLPRAEPVYLMPGSHILRVLRAGEPETIAAFSGDAGTRLPVKLPQTRPRALTPKVPLDSGGWFVQTAAGPAFAWSGIGSLPAAQLEQSAGVLAQAHGGYRLPNGIMIALNTGLLYLESSLDVNKQMGAFQFSYTGTYQWQFFSSFVALTGGWGTSVNERSDVWFRAGLGLMSTQSKHVFADAALVPLFGIGGPQSKTLPVDMAGRQVIRSVPGYASFEVGGALRVGPLRVGLLIGGLFILEEGPLLPTLYVTPRATNPDFFDGSCPATVDPNDADCVPKLRFLGQRTYRPAFVFLPQIVIGF